MSMQDPLADMFIRIKNAQMIGHKEVAMPSSKLKVELAKVLASEGYIRSYEVEATTKPTLLIQLKYYKGKPVIDVLKRVSKSSLRIYKKKDEIKPVRGGFGIAIYSTSLGILTDKQAVQHGLGGELLCEVA